MRSLLFSADRDGNVLAALPTATIDQYSFRSNAPGGCRFTVPALLQPNATSSWDWPAVWPDTWGDISVLRDGQPLVEVLDPDQGHEVGVLRGGTVVWQGPLVAVDETVDDNDSPVVRFGALDLLHYLSDWHILTTIETSGYPSGETSGPISGATVVDRDQHAIVKALVDHGQGQAGADRRIDTTGITDSGTLRDRQYKAWELPNVWEQVRNLCNVQGGPDVAIDPATRELQLWTSRGRRRPATVFNDRNVRRFGRRKDRSQLASEVIGLGAGEGESTLRVFRRASTSVGRVGLVQHVTPHKGVTRKTTLTEHADRELGDRSTVPDLYSVTVATDDPRLFSYGLGDEVRIHYPSRFESVDEFRRLVGIDVHPADGEQPEEATLHMEPL